MRTSGKAPLEKTLNHRLSAKMVLWRDSRWRCVHRPARGHGCLWGGGEACRGKKDGQISEGGSNSHQQTGFTAGTVADDDELSADLSHGVCEALREREMEEAAGWRWEGRVLRWWLMAVVDGMKGRSRKTDVRSRSRAEGGV